MRVPPLALGASFSMLLGPWVPRYSDVRHAVSLQISQVCQLCQQSPRLFSNHAAQLHTLLVSA